jgi:formamidopyrimidine-DNA glycosylase
MPELPEVETTRLGLAPHSVGLVVADICVRNSRLRWPVDASLTLRLRGQRLLAIDRRGKYLLWRFETGVLLIHLGMSGSLRVIAQDEPPRVHDHIDLVFAAGVTVRYHDPRRFGAFVWHDGQDCTGHPLLTHLGPEPLADDWTAAVLGKRLASKRVPIKTALMDAQVVVGVGNIYANEALFLARIHPLKPAQSLNSSELERLVQAVRERLSAAIAQGGTTLRDFVGGDGRPGYFAQQLAVYGRGAKPCRVCATELEQLMLQGRATVFCPRCQPL